MNYKEANVLAVQAGLWVFMLSRFSVPVLDFGSYFYSQMRTWMHEAPKPSIVHLERLL